MHVHERGWRHCSALAAAATRRPRPDGTAARPPSCPYARSNGVAWTWSKCEPHARGADGLQELAVGPAARRAARAARAPAASACRAGSSPSGSWRARRLPASRPAPHALPASPRRTSPHPTPPHPALRQATLTTSTATPTPWTPSWPAAASTWTATATRERRGGWLWLGRSFIHSFIHESGWGVQCGLLGWRACSRRAPCRASQESDAAAPPRLPASRRPRPPSRWLPTRPWHPPPCPAQPAACTCCRPAPASGWGWATWAATAASGAACGSQAASGPRCRQGRPAPLLLRRTVVCRAPGPSPACPPPPAPRRCLAAPGAAPGCNPPPLCRRRRHLAPPPGAGLPARDPAQHVPGPRHRVQRGGPAGRVSATQSRSRRRCVRLRPSPPPRAPRSAAPAPAGLPRRRARILRPPTRVPLPRPHHTGARRYFDSTCSMGHCCESRCPNVAHGWQMGWYPVQAIDGNDLKPGTTLKVTLFPAAVRAISPAQQGVRLNVSGGRGLGRRSWRCLGRQPPGSCGAAAPRRQGISGPPHAQGRLLPAARQRQLSTPPTGGPPHRSPPGPRPSRSRCSWATATPRPAPPTRRRAPASPLAACLPACLPAGLPACLPACALPACALPACRACVRSLCTPCTWKRWPPACGQPAEGRGAGGAGALHRICWGRDRPPPARPPAAAPRWSRQRRPAPLSPSHNGCTPSNHHSNSLRRRPCPHPCSCNRRSATGCTSTRQTSSTPLTRPSPHTRQRSAVSGCGLRAGVGAVAPGRRLGPAAAWT